ncbi:MAG: hypothetical protein QXX08_06125, partial [Candidatus Bathyarchaeia archaeon]
MEWTPELVSIVSIIASSTIAILSLYFSYWERKSDKEFQAKEKKIERDFQARQRAEGYYRPLYGRIAVLDEMIRGYLRSLRKGRAKVFSVQDSKYKELTSKEILDEYLKSYNEFTSFYIKTKCEGYELFISEDLKDALVKLWAKADEFSENNEKLKDSEEIESFHRLAEETTRLMENL